MSISRWYPMRSLRRMQEDMDRLFGQFFGRAPSGDREEVRVPAVDISETESDLIVEAELPGVAKEDLDIEVLPDRLTISAKSSQKREVEEESYLCRECSWREFRRILPLPSEVKAENAKATLKDGVLQVTLPKLEVAKASAPKKLKIE